MPKSDKATINKRKQDVVRLLVAGAQFADLQRFATAQGWQVSDRQVRRYMKAAYRHLARAAKVDRNQLLGRHLAQRKALYAHSVKTNDVRAALQVLRDEAALEGLYPAANGSSDGNGGLGPCDSPLSLRERISRGLKAQFGNDETEQLIVAHISPQVIYECLDTEFPIAFLQVMAMRHTIAQLELLVLFHQVSGHLAGADDDARIDRLWRILRFVAHRIRVGMEAWARFTEDIGVDGQALIDSNNLGGMLPAKGSILCQLAPSEDELPDLAAHMECPLDDLATVDSSTRHWKKLYASALHE